MVFFQKIIYLKVTTITLLCVEPHYTTSSCFISYYWTSSEFLNKSVMITFLKEWWNCRQKQPSQQESRPGASGSQLCQSYERFHNSRRKAQNTEDSPKVENKSESKSDLKLNTALPKSRQSTKVKWIKLLPQVTRWCQGPEQRRFDPLGWFCCVWCQKERQQGANGEITHRERGKKRWVMEAHTWAGKLLCVPVSGSNINLASFYWQTIAWRHVRSY